MLEPVATPSFGSILARLHTEKDLAAYVVAERAALQARWTPGSGAGRAWMNQHADLLDAVIRRLFALAHERALGASPGSSPGVAILATGGYGQGLLAPHSDLDLTFLSARDDDSPVLREMFRLVMDVLLSGAKIKVGYGYRTIAEIGGETLDHQTQTALLDARLLAGDSDLFTRFDHVFHTHLQTADFLFRKWRERLAMRARMGGSPFVAQPNIKEGVGGMREWQTAAWLAKVRFGKSGEGLWRDLVRRKVITADDYKDLQGAREFLLSVRASLHIAAGERRDLLSPPWQDRAAQQLEPTGDRDPFLVRVYSALSRSLDITDKVAVRCLESPLSLGSGDNGLSSVRMAVTVTDPAQADRDLLWPLRALAFCQRYDLDLALPAEERIQQFALEQEAHRESNAELLGEMGAFFVRELLAQPGDLYATLRRMRRSGLLRLLLPELDMCMTLAPRDPSHALTVGEHTLRVVRNLSDLGLHRLRASPGPAPFGAPTDIAPPRGGYVPTPRPAALLSGGAGDAPPGGEWGGGDSPLGYDVLLTAVEAPATLLLAALLHDVGKRQASGANEGDEEMSVAGGSAGRGGAGGAQRRGHAIIGAEMAQTICQRLGCDDLQTARVAFLVRRHLLMAETSRLRDLGLPETIRDFTQIVTDADLLRMLSLLTWADTAAVGPGVWTAMRAQQLGELYERAEVALQAQTALEITAAATMGQEEEAIKMERGISVPLGAASPDPAAVTPARLDAVRERIRRQLAREKELGRRMDILSGGDSARAADAIRAHVDAMPPAYLLNTPLSVIGLHLTLIERLRSGGPASPPVVDVRTPPPPNALSHTEVTVVARDDEKPGLLAKITGVLLAYDVSIYAAQVFTRDVPGLGRIVIDTLWADVHGRPLAVEKRADVEEAIQAVLSGERPLDDLLAQRLKSRRADWQRLLDPASLPIRRVFVDDQDLSAADSSANARASEGGPLAPTGLSPVSAERDSATLVDIEAADEPGALYRLSRLLTSLSWNIHAARVSTWGGSVRCAFYVTDAAVGAGGESRSPDAARTALQSALRLTPGARAQTM